MSNPRCPPCSAWILICCQNHGARPRRACMRPALLLFRQVDLQSMQFQTVREANIVNSGALGGNLTKSVTVSYFAQETVSTASQWAATASVGKEAELVFGWERSQRSQVFTPLGTSSCGASARRKLLYHGSPWQNSS